MTVVEVVVAEAGEHVDDAAEIWAEATAARDGDVDVAPLDLSRPIIEAVLNSSDRSLLLIALDADRRALGFAAAEPTSDLGDRRAELRYLGVRPDAWGYGIAAQLLTALRRQLKAAGFATAQLLVYTDNPRASALYQRLGWSPYGAPTPHPRSGRPEQPYTLNLVEDELVDEPTTPRSQRPPSAP